MQKWKTKALSLLLAALMLGLTVLPASAASATASTIQLAKYTGTVNVTNSSGRSLSKRNDMLLYNGYHVETSAKSCAWISLDDKKLTKLDAVSKVEVRKSGKKLELLLKSGNLFFNITEPLESDETLNVRTSTMVVGIRGTSGCIKVVDRWSAEIYVLEGTVQCSVTDPVTGQAKAAEVHGGEKVTATAYPQDREGDKCGIIQDEFESGDIDGFVLTELAQDPELCGKIYEATGMDVQDVLETAQERLEQDQREMQDKLDSIQEEVAKQDGSASGQPGWSGGGGPSEPAPPPSNTPVSPPTPSAPADSSTRSYTMKLTAAQVQAYLNEDGVTSVTLLANSSPSGPAGNTLEVDTDMTIPSGKTLTLSDGIDVTIDDAHSLTVNGVLTGTGAMTNNGALTVNSSGMLKMDYIEGSGGLTNTAAGRIVTNDIVISADSTNSGAIEGGVTVSHGTFTMDGGTIDGGTGSAVTLAVGASFIMSGGNITSSDDWATVSSDGSLHLNGGMVTNDGEGYAVSVESADDTEVGDTAVIRAVRQDLFAIGGESKMPENYTSASKGDGYYYLTKLAVAASGECGTAVTWTLYNDGTLTIDGTGDMEDHDSSVSPPWGGYAGQIMTVVIRDGVTGIGSYAFSGCGNLTGVTIPASAAGIKAGAFDGCTGLTDVYYSGSEDQWREISVEPDGNGPLLNANIHCTLSP